MSQSISSAPTRQLPRPIYLAAFAGAFLFLYLRLFQLPATPFVIDQDQILLFARAVQLAHGKVLYRDVFEIVTPGTDLLYAAAFRIVGVHAWVMAGWLLVLGLALVSLLTWIARHVLRGVAVLLPGLLFLVFDYSSALDATHHWYSTLAAMAAVAVLLRGLSARRIAVAGALCGVATLFTQTQGCAVFVAVACYLVWVRRAVEDRGRLPRELAALTLPFAVVVASVLTYYGWRAGFHTILYDLVVYPVRYMSTSDVNSPRTYLRQFPAIHSALDVVRAVPFVVIYSVTPYACLVSLVRLWRERGRLPEAECRRLVLLQMVGVALALSVAMGPRFHRLCTVAPLCLLLAVWWLQCLEDGGRYVRGVLYGVAALFAVWLPASRELQRHVVLQLPVGRTAFLDPQQAREFAWLGQRTRPQELAFNDSLVGLYFELENPAAVEFVNNNDSTRPEQVRAALDAFERQPPRWMVMLRQSPGEGRVQDSSGPFREYVHRHYRRGASFEVNNGRLTEEIWERR